MHYPIWHIPNAGGALTIAVISIFHVVIAHFAVGAGIFNALSERRAIKHNDKHLLQFIRDNSLFLIYLAFVAGAVSGVGIWFTIGIVAPEATTFLIRLFLWIWATEWVFFLVELASGYVYYFTWDRLTPRIHNLVGWVYAVAAYMSLVMINGILCFMLTPGEWLRTGDLFDAWLNPSFWPALLMRSVSALALAGLFAAIVAAARRKKYDQAAREKIVVWGSRFLLPLAAMPVFALWYFATIPAEARELAMGGAIAMTMFFAFGTVLSFVIGVYAFFGMFRRARDMNLETALLMTGIAVLATGSMEFVREGVRKPYVLYNIMYSNGISAKDAPQLNQEGILIHSAWVTPDTVHYQGDVAIGEAIYRIECLRCHEINGYNAMRPLLRDWNAPLILSALNQLDKLKAFMPPFVGTEHEKRALAVYLLTLNGHGTQPDSLAPVNQALAPGDSTISTHGEDSIP